MQYGCIGEKLGHSFSAEIHEMLDSHPYRLCELAPDELGAFLRAADFRGINVTIPYKQAVLPYLGETDTAAERIGAVNTIVNRGGVLCGYNTDFDGLRALLLSIGVPLTGKTVAILGTGGTSRTATSVATSMGAGGILHVSRRAGEGRISYDELYRDHAARVSVLINTTPVGMYPAVDGCPVDVARLPALEAVADVVYNPLRTRLVLAARARGIPASGGLLMLAAQAVRASEYFTGSRYPEGTAERICAVLTERKENIVLSGMPGCGKARSGSCWQSVPADGSLTLTKHLPGISACRPLRSSDRQGRRHSGMPRARFCARYWLGFPARSWHWAAARFCARKMSKPSDRTESSISSTVRCPSWFRLPTVRFRRPARNWNGATQSASAATV